MAPSKSLIQRFDELTIPFSALLRILLGGYFTYAGVNKVRDPSVFLKAVHLYDMLPESPAVYLNTTAVLLPWLEIVCGAALVLGLFRRGAGTIIALMLCVFSPAILLRALEVMREESIAFTEVAFDCGCGTGAETIWIKLLQNLGLFLVALCVVTSRSSRFSLPGLLQRGRVG